MVPLDSGVGPCKELNGPKQFMSFAHFARARRPEINPHKGAEKQEDNHSTAEGLQTFLGVTFFREEPAKGRGFPQIPGLRILDPED